MDAARLTSARAWARAAGTVAWDTIAGVRPGEPPEVHRAARDRARAPFDRLDLRRVAQAAVLAIWALFFAWLGLSGKDLTFVGPRTRWIVPFGAISLGLCALALLAGARTRRRVPGPTLRDLGAHVLFLAPVIAVLLVPNPQLGALAAHRKGPGTVPAGDVRATAGPIGLLAIVAANQDPSYVRKVGARAGRPAAIDGEVTETKPGRFQLTRFRIYCCAADALPYTVDVSDPRGLAHGAKENRWLAVTGTLQERGGVWEVLATGVRPIARPDDPYV